MAKLRHIALSVRDPERSAEFYMKVFGMKRVDQWDLDMGRGVYLSDGVVNLALIKFKSEKVAGGKDWLEGRVGAHHLGFVVEDLDESRKTIEENGGQLYLDLPMARDSIYFEQKYLDPDGVHFDISHNGWVGTEDQK